MASRKVVGFGARLDAIRGRLAPRDSARAFAARIGVSPSTYQSWEGRGSAPPVEVLAAALSRLPGVDGLALAKWAREGGSDMPIGGGAGSARPAEGRSEAVMRNVLRLWAVVETLPEEAAEALRPILKDLSGSLSSTSKHKVLRPTG